MEKTSINNKTAVLTILLLALITSTTLFLPQKPAVLSSTAPAPTNRQQIQTTYITYKGESGKDALTLLKQKTTIEQDRSGLVTAISGRKADNTKHEYWAFYINGKNADVGPAQYITKVTDTIQWKIEKY